MVATSLSTLSEPVTRTIVEDGQLTGQRPEELSQQILGDLKALITSVQKTCTNLTLALRPNAKQLESKDAKLSPISGLDDASLIAAKAQIITILDDCIPKLIFLARKSISEATIFRYVPKTKEDFAKEKAEKEFVQSKGGHFVIPAHARETEKLEKVRGRGLGKAWSKIISSAVFELLESLGELSKSYMDERTKMVLQKASAKRDKVDGLLTSHSREEEEVGVAKNAKEARQLALQATAVVWEVCDSTLNGSRKLLNSNREAVQASWKIRTETLKDALSEFKQALEEEEEKDAESLDADDPLVGLEPMHLDEEQKVKAKKYLPLIKACCQFHRSVGETYLSKASSVDDASVDFDDIDQAAETILEAVDDLIAVLLYGSGFGEDDDDKSDEEDVQGDLDDAKEGLLEAVVALRDATNQENSTGSRFDDQVKRIKEL